PKEWVEWSTSVSHKDRRRLWRALEEDLGALTAYSLRDRDDQALRSVDDDLRDTGEDAGTEAAGFYARKWRRRYSATYLFWPPTLCECCSSSEEDVRELLQDQCGIAVGATFPDSHAPQAILDVRAKEILHELGVSALDVANRLPAEAIWEDVRMVIK